MSLADDLDLKPDELRQELSSLISNEQATIASTSWQAHPHIKMREVTVEVELRELGSAELSKMCAYPTVRAVERATDTSVFQDKPFTRALVRGAPQLIAFPFRLDVLDLYADDPRYDYHFWDYGGWINIGERTTSQWTSRTG